MRLFGNVFPERLADEDEFIRWDRDMHVREEGAVHVEREDVLEVRLVVEMERMDVVVAVEVLAGDDSVFS